MQEKMIEEAVQEIENNARDVRLSEQAIFRSVLDRKKKSLTRVVLITVMMSASLFVIWLLFHCVPLVLRA